MIVDATAAARRGDAERVRAWLAEQRVFISSAMAYTAVERRAVATAVEEAGARAVWFEEFARDADAEEAYLTEVDAAGVYIGILNEQYGRLNPPDGFSATEAEYLRARDGGKRVHVLVAAAAPEPEGHLARFVERVGFHTRTENYVDSGDLVRRVRRRLDELAAEALSPWVKLGDMVFRADSVDDAGAAVTIRAGVSDEIAYRLEAMRDRQFGGARLGFVHRSRVVEGELANVRRSTHAGGVVEYAADNWFQLVEYQAAGVARGEFTYEKAPLLQACLPPVLAERYDAQFLARFAVVAGDFVARVRERPMSPQPSCVAEELALLAIADHTAVIGTRPMSCY